LFLPTIPHPPLVLSFDDDGCKGVIYKAQSLFGMAMDKNIYYCVFTDATLTGQIIYNSTLFWDVTPYSLEDNH
jgi:hypothetical protein